MACVVITSTLMESACRLSAGDAVRPGRVSFEVATGSLRRQPRLGFKTPRESRAFAACRTRTLSGPVRLAGGGEEHLG